MRSRLLVRAAVLATLIFLVVYFSKPSVTASIQSQLDQLAKFGDASPVTDGMPKGTGGEVKKPADEHKTTDDKSKSKPADKPKDKPADKPKDKPADKPKADDSKQKGPPQNRPKKEQQDKPAMPPPADRERPWLDKKVRRPGLENATFVTLARNDELDKLLPTIRSFEDRFNVKYGYDWVFLNDEPFSDEFKSVVSGLITGEAKFGKLDKDLWGYPDWIDLEKAAEGRKKMVEQNVMYGASEPYRHMCRFESGLFFKHSLMKEYRYYWRVEPETSLLCDVDYDVFKFFRTEKKKYGFTISIYEWFRTIPTLWPTVLEFIKKNPKAVHPNNMQGFVTDDDMKTYNLCHYWTNFEIADMEFWRSQVYQDYFNYLDKAGGFYYERWGDAPVHSIAAALFLDKNELHFFDDIGYSHPPFYHCPQDYGNKNLKCSCRPKGSFDLHDSSCLKRYYISKNDTVEMPYYLVNHPNKNNNPPDM